VAVVSALLEPPTWAEMVDAIRACPECKPGTYDLCAAHDLMLSAAIGPCLDPDCPACRPA
jgi:hypothetical protein